MKTCLAREQGTGGKSEGENRRRWTFVNDKKCIKNAFESNRSWLLSEVVEKACFSTKDVSKSWAACSTSSTEKGMGHLPVSQHQMHSIMCYGPPNGRFIKSITVHRKAVFPSFQKSDTVPRGHGYPRMFENEHSVKTKPRWHSY